MDEYLEKDVITGGLAAQYVRMSTEHQRYSTENQAAEIARYASLNGYTIIRTYEDSGKSGLKLTGREALQRLIEDVQSPTCEFTTILVYDVSRWGRFQNADEAAYLEYLCTRAGIAVEYCAEQFSNDGSLTTTIIKNMKRAMAGEYSRDLSRKVFRGQCHLVELGYRQGGAPGFGLRRQLIDDQGCAKGHLNRGERKSLQTDRVILVPGPEDEIETVNRIYRLFVENGLSELTIASTLNREGSRTDLGRPWTRGTVHQLLTNEKYIGNNVFNRISFKLKIRRVRNPPEAVVRAVGSFHSIVPMELFDAAKEIIAKRSERLSDDEMLSRLAALLLRTGRLSAIIIDEDEEMPPSSAYGCRFGSLLKAYKLVGFTPERDYRYVEANRILRGMHPEITDSIIAAIESVGGSARNDRTNGTVVINRELIVSILISRCTETKAGSSRWKIRLERSTACDLYIAVRMAPGNQSVLDYYLLPTLDFERHDLRISTENWIGIDAYRCDDLARFIALTQRSPLRRTS